MLHDNIKGAAIGLLLGSTLTGGIVFAKTGTQNIEVAYDNIKVYKDNILYELKDSNGGTIEPFIYEGTTYVPVRGAAQICDMQVDWDGANKSIYLWDEVPKPDGTYLIDVCPPYETSNYREYKPSQNKSFTMGGTKYTNGFTLGETRQDSEYALINLNSKYSTINFKIGHQDGSAMSKRTVQFYLDGKLIKEMEIDPQGLPQTVSLPVNYGLQLKIAASGSGATGFGNITVQ